MRVIALAAVLCILTATYLQIRMRSYLSSQDRWGRALWFGPWMPASAFASGGLRYRNAARVTMILGGLLLLALAIRASTGVHS